MKLHNMKKLKNVVVSCKRSEIFDGQFIFEIRVRGLEEDGKDMVKTCAHAFMDDEFESLAERIFDRVVMDMRNAMGWKVRS